MLTSDLKVSKSRSPSLTPTRTGLLDLATAAADVQHVSNKDPCSGPQYGTILPGGQPATYYHLGYKWNLPSWKWQQFIPLGLAHILGISFAFPAWSVFSSSLILRLTESGPAPK